MLKAAGNDMQTGASGGVALVVAAQQMKLDWLSS